MIIGKPFPFLINYVNQLSDALENTQIGTSMTGARKRWLTFCLTAIIVTNSICWRKFSRVSFGCFSEALLSWHFRSPMTVDWRVSKHLQKGLSLPFLFFDNRARL